MKNDPDDIDDIEDEDEQWLSEHCCAMRRALEDCQSRWDRLCSQQQPRSLRLKPGTIAKPFRELASVTHCGWYDLVEFPEDRQLSPPIVHAFFQDYLVRNRPCLIRGLAHTYFAGEWTDPPAMRAWIQQHAFLEPLPVRQANLEQNLLDEDGRATECRTQSTLVVDWIQYLDDCSAADIEDKADDHTSHHQRHYLKDWHLEQALEQHQKTEPKGSHTDGASPTDSSSLEASSDSTSRTTTSLPLSYTLPPFFAQDLLNPFLQTFTGGDYRFVYWGPKGSTTEWHSDVLHSFSWSFNVFGCKEWTFATDDSQENASASNNLPHNNSLDSPPPQEYDTILQHAGELVFVPSQWRHRVVNREETLSINRNWITAANLARTWECLRLERVAIAHELEQWGDNTSNVGDSNTMDAHESMLRGCVSLDVTAFCLMIIYRVIGLLEQATVNARSSRPKDCDHDDASATASMLDWEIRMLTAFLRESVMNPQVQEDVQLLHRLQATLSSVPLGKQAHGLMHEILECLDGMNPA